MTSSRRIRLLCVDDEPNVLDALKRQLRRRCEVSVAQSGAEGLEIVGRQDDFEVIMSDMRMPEMNGAVFLKKVREVAPDAVRLLLTGQSDLDDAVAAVNDGKIFRFLRKPCPPEILVEAIEDAASQHELVTAERVLLQQTLHGSIKTLTDILALTDPAAFGRSNRAKGLATELIAGLDVADSWQIEVAAMLSQIGSMTLPKETAEKAYHGRKLTPREQEMTDRLPHVAAKLLGNIPRLEEVREILKYQNKRYDGLGIPKDNVKGEDIPFGARVLKLVLDFDVLETQGVSRDVAAESLRGREGWYDPELLRTFLEAHGQSVVTTPIREVRLVDVLVGMVFIEDVVSESGTLLISRGQEITPTLFERIRNFSENTAVREPLRVRLPAELRQEKEAAREAHGAVQGACAD